MALNPKQWLDEIAREKKARSKFREAARSAYAHYLNEKSSKLNIFYSNTEILRGITFSGLPEPQVTRRFLDPDPVAKLAALVLERSLKFCIDDYDLFSVLNATNLDWNVAGLGQVRLRFLADFSRAEDDEEGVVGQAIKAEIVTGKPL